MENIDFSILWNIFGMILTGVITFLSTRFNLKTYTRDQVDKLRKELNETNLNIERLRSSDALQQQILNQLRVETSNIISDMVEIIKQKKRNHE